MILPEVRAEMRRLVLVERLAIETVARKFGVHHSTVRRALIDVDTEPQLPKPGLLEEFKPYLVQRILALPEITGTRLFEEVRGRGFSGSIAIVRRYVAKVRTPRPRKAYLRIETEPGEQAQVDWGSFGHFRVGSSQRPLSAFAMVLSWSRAIFVDFALDQRLETFLAMHRRALDFFGGVPKRILYDNLKSVVLHHIGSTIQFNPRFLSFAGHYLFEPNAAPVRYPEAKGRVESAIKYLRHSFFYGRSFSSLTDLQQQAAAWRDLTANQRIHATTRERPAERLLVERPRLRALPERRYDTDIVLPLIVSKEARVKLDTNSYSVPHDYVGKTVQLRADDFFVRVTCEGYIIANHIRCWDKHRAIEDPKHIADLVARRPAAARPKHRQRLESLSPACRMYLQEIARRHIDLRCEVQKLVRLGQRYSETEVADAMAQALANKSFGARYVRALMDQARFKKGLPEPTEPITTGNPVADSVEVTPHDMESYDALFKQPAAVDPDDIEL
jgi:transposase